MANFVLIDFETSSACDLKKAGSYRYAEDITTEIICLGYTIDGATPELWTPDTGIPEKFLKEIMNPKCMFVAFNCAFEKPIWRNIMVPVFGVPDIPNDRWHDVQAACAMKGVPLKLEYALRALGLGAKDTEGTSTVRTFSAFDKHGRMGGDPSTRPARLARTYTYCRDNDVVQELSLHRRVKGLGEKERAVWLLDQTINERGVRLDMEYVRAAQDICDQAAGPMSDEFMRLTGLKPSQREKVLEWANGHGAKLGDLRKETIDAALGIREEDDDTILEPVAELPEIVRRPLEIRRILGSASIKKLAAMRSSVCTDGRARGLLQYHGATTGRWAGRLLQPQNFPRPSLKVDGKGHDTQQLVDAIMTSDAQYVNAIFGPPIEAVISGLRHVIIASPGCELVVGDFATVEARIVLALAGQYDKVDLIAKGRDIYIDMAESIYGVPVDKEKDPERRQVGKNTVLGCGFQMGAAKFQARYAADKPLEFAKQCIDTYREEFAPLVPRLWKGLENAAVRTVWDKKPHEFRGIVYKLRDQWLICRLPSGRELWYLNPIPVRKPMPWDAFDIRPGFEYTSFKNGVLKKVSMYGGLTTENVVQAIARDLLVSAMFRCEQNALPVVLTSHDEIVADAQVQGDNATLIRQLMCETEQWAKDLKIPVGAETWVGDRYRK